MIDRVAAGRAARVWNCPVSIFGDGQKLITVKIPCLCKGYGVVARPWVLRGKPVFTFDPCPACNRSYSRKSRRYEAPVPPLSHPVA